MYDIAYIRVLCVRQNKVITVNDEISDGEFQFREYVEIVVSQ